MNTRSIRFLTLALFALAFCLLPLTASAQDAAAPAGPLSADTQDFLARLISGLATQHPWVAAVIAFVGSMRLWAKPAVSIVHQVIDLTPSKVDDTWWARAHEFFTVNPVGKLLAWGIDWLTSIKFVPPGGAAKTS